MLLHANLVLPLVSVKCSSITWKHVRLSVVFFVQSGGISGLCLHTTYGFLRSDTAGL